MTEHLYEIILTCSKEIQSMFQSFFILVSFSAPALIFPHKFVF